jgi:hypothetical protein
MGYIPSATMQVLQCSSVRTTVLATVLVPPQYSYSDTQSDSTAWSFHRGDKRFGGKCELSNGQKVKNEHKTITNHFVTARLNCCKFLLQCCRKTRVYVPQLSCSKNGLIWIQIQGAATGRIRHRFQPTMTSKRVTRPCPQALLEVVMAVLVEEQKEEDQHYRSRYNHSRK